MRHRRKGRILGRSPSHQRALLRNLTAALFLTERVYDEFDIEDNEPKVKGRIITTITKAKEVRPLVEKCITLAVRATVACEAAEEFATDAERGSDAWKKWRNSDQWVKWNQAVVPGVNARRRIFKLIHDKEATAVLFAEIAPRFIGREGGYTRIMRLVKPRLGDGGIRAILELVGVRDRVSEKSEKPAFETESAPAEKATSTEEAAK